MDFSKFTQYLNALVSNSILPSFSGFFNRSSREISETISSSIDELKEEFSKDNEETLRLLREDIKKSITRVEKLKLAREYTEYLNKMEFVKGEKGDSPSKEELQEAIKPLLPTDEDFKSIIEPLIIKPKDGVDGSNGKDGKDGKNGKDGKKGKDGENGSNGKDGVDGANGSPDKPKDIVAKLESLKGDKRLDFSAIKNVPDLAKETLTPLFNKAVKFLRELQDVVISSPANNDVLKYNSASGKWVNGTGGGGSGTVDSIVAGNNIDVDATDPANPIVSVETLTLADISDVTASITELNYVDGVTSDIQTQLNGKQASGSYLTSANIVATITNGVTTNAPSEDAVFDALALKAPLASPTFTGTVTVPVGLTGVLRADTGVVSVDSDVTDIVAAGTSTSQGKLELATDAETVTGTDTARATTPANITAKMSAPGAIGNTTASTGKFTSVETTGNIELGNASDTTLSRSAAGVLAVEGVVIPSISSTNTLTNKRVTRRLTTTNAPGATPTTNSDNVDVMNFTGINTAITSMTTNLSGTPVDGDLLEFRFLDDGTARGITWGSSFASTTVTLPTTTVISTCLRVGFEWRAASSKWECVATC